MPYRRMVFAQGFFTDGQSIIEQVSSLLIFVLVSEKGKENNKLAIRFQLKQPK